VATARDPLFYTVRVNDPGDPLSRGYCGGIACEPTHEFHDVAIAPDGTAWASFSDGAMPDPAQDPADGSNIGIAGHLYGGPPLIGGKGTPRETSPRACTRRRRITVRVARPKRGRIVSARVTLNGRRVAVRHRGRRYSARLDLRRVRGSTAVVRMRVRTSTGRRLQRTRRSVLCG
jgi:hypothetical protein